MNLLDQINEFFGIFVSFLAPVLFYSIKGFPLFVVVLLFNIFQGIDSFIYFVSKNYFNRNSII